MSQNQNCECPKTTAIVPITSLGLGMDLSGLNLDGGIDYSLEEQWTGRLWIDGRKIYQKTVLHKATIPHQTVVEFPHGIENMETLINLQATRKTLVNAALTDYSILPIIGAGPNSWWACYIRGGVIIPFLVALQSRAYAACISFMAGVIPPMPMFGRSLL